MALELQLNQKQLQKLVMTQQMQMSLQLLQMNTLELEELVEQELLENPMLAMEEDYGSSNGEPKTEAGAEETSRETEAEEVDSPGSEDKLDENFEAYLTDLEPRVRNYSPREQYEEHDFNDYVASRDSLQDHLLWQLGCSRLSGQEMRIGEYIVGNIDDDGYLRSGPAEIAAACETTEERVEAVLRVIQNFDPSGVGARRVAEALLIQMRYLGIKNELAEQILEHHFEDLEHRRFKQIAKALGCSENEIRDVIKLISKLEPRPGRAHSRDEVKYIVPDVYVKKVDNDYMIYLNEGHANHLFINSRYKKLLLDKSKVKSKDRKYAMEKFNAAMWLIKNIERRKATILKVTRAIIDHQREFLEKGIPALKPLTLKEIADEVGFHESTIARVTNGKYVETPRGIFELKFFFSSKISDSEGGHRSSRSAKDVLKMLVEQEPPEKPYSDAKLVKLLEERGIQIARRTVSKYREQLHILPAKLRKKV